MYIAAYDTESPDCLHACRTIAAVHRQYDMPGTFFIVGRTLEANPKEYRELLADPLFEVASHTYSHRTLLDHPFCGPGASDEEVREQLVRGKEVVEQVFERPCIGMRPGCGFEHGLRGAPHVLRAVADAGYEYTSSLLWGPHYSLPALLTQPFTYAEDGFPQIWELPGHGWQENLLKDNNRWGPRRLTLWPPQMPEAIPDSFITSARQEADINRIFMERAAAEELAFVSIIWHPWSLDRFDPEMEMLHLTFRAARELGLKPGTYADLCRHVQQTARA